MKRKEIEIIMQNIIDDRGVPRNIKESLTDSLCVLGKKCPVSEKLAHIGFALDDALNNPNISMYTRTNILSAVSSLEEIKQQI